MKAFRTMLAILLAACGLAAQAPKKSAPPPSKHAPTSVTAQKKAAPAQTPEQALAQHERWAIKTSVPDADPKHAKKIAFADFVALAAPPGVQDHDPRFKDTRIPASPNSLNVKEGDLVTVTVWLHLVATESDDDYHIQVSGSAQDGKNCLIVEVPKPQLVPDSSAALRPAFQGVRDIIKAKMLKGQEPSGRGNLMAHPPYVQVTGQLFFDTSHAAHPEQRGRKHMPAATAWEVHPVTALAFAPKPMP